MAQSPRQPSLPQARDNHYHLHLHNLHASYEHTHHQPRQPSPDALDSLVTQVIQTVSLVQVVDSAGLPIEVQTYYAPPATIVVDPASGVSVDISGLDPASVLPTPEPIPDIISDEVPQSTTSTVIVPEEAATASQDPVLTSIPLSTSPPFPTLNPVFNGTNPFLNSSFFTNSSLIRPFVVTSPTTISVSSSSDGIPTSTDLTGSSTTVVSEVAPTDSTSGSTPVVGDGGPAIPSPTSRTDSTDSEPATPTGTVVGSVVGSVAGAAILALLVLLALKWKKRNHGRLLLGDDSSGSRGLFSRGGAPDGSSGGGMAQRSLTFGVPATLAGMAGARRFSQQPAEPARGSEKGFYRVSGKKLPSVLQVGGDGYSDPRESVMSGESIYYRDSQAFFEPGQSASPRLALGSPMRPVSGIPVMRSGPARTPVTETGPFFDTSTSDFPPRDPIGRSLTSQNGSRGSSSRFTERV